MVSAEPPDSYEEDRNNTLRVLPCLINTPCTHQDYRNVPSTLCHFEIKLLLLLLFSNLNILQFYYCVKAIQCIITERIIPLSAAAVALHNHYHLLRYRFPKIGPLRQDSKVAKSWLQHLVSVCTYFQ